MLHQDEGGIGKSIPDGRFPETREISRGRSPREISRVEGNLERFTEAVGFAPRGQSYNSWFGAPGAPGAPGASGAPGAPGAPNTLKMGVLGAPGALGAPEP